MSKRWKVIEKGREREGPGKNDLHDVPIRTLRTYFKLHDVSDRFIKQLEHDLHDKRFKVFDWLGMTLGDYPGRDESSMEASEKLAKYYLETDTIPNFFREIERELETLS